MFRLAVLGLLLSGSGYAGAGYASDVFLCVDTLDCGGFCGTQQEVKQWLGKECHAGQTSEPAGPCFDDCWNTCTISAEHQPGDTFCTLECMALDCPGPAEASGLTSVVEPECPAPDPNTLCTLQYAPVECGTSCSYSNQCFASAAGWNPGECSSEDLTSF